MAPYRIFANAFGACRGNFYSYLAPCRQIAPRKLSHSRTIYLNAAYMYRKNWMRTRVFKYTPQSVKGLSPRGNREIVMRAKGFYQELEK